MTGKTFRAIVGSLVIGADISVYVYEHIIQHIPTNGWQEARDHLPYLALGYLLIDWSHAIRTFKMLIRSRLSGQHRRPRGHG